MAKVTWLVSGRHRGSAQGWKEGKENRKRKRKEKKKKDLNVSLKPVGVD